MSERDQNEASGQQPPIGQQNENQLGNQSLQQSEGKSAEQELDKADKQEQDLQPEGQQSGQPGESTDGFVGSQGQDSGEYLQLGGNGFAEQGQGAPEQGDIERGTERSQDSDSDIEGSSDNS